MRIQEQQRHIYTAVSVVMLLAVLTYLLHGSALSGGWRVDDPWILLFVCEHPGALGYFFSPDIWQSLGVPFFTPWLALDFRLDAALSTLNPRVFYLHHLMVIWLAAVLTFLLLRRFVGELWSAFAAALFLLGAPVVVLAQQLMSRHYASGLVFAILAIICWLHRREQHGRYFLALAVFCYLMAILNKEIYAPLPLILFFWGRATLKERLRNMAPFALALLVFVVWRAVMVGSAVGGYGGRFNDFGDILQTLKTLPQIFFGQWWFVPVVLLFLLLIAWCRLPNQALVVIASVCAVLMPFLAIQASANISDFRFGFLPWWSLCILLVVASAKPACACPRFLPYWLWRVVCLLPLAAFSMLSLLNGFKVARDYNNIAAVYDVQGRFLLSYDERTAYVPGGELLAVLSFQYGMTGLKKNILGKGTPYAVPTLESAALLAGDRPLYVYDPVGQRMNWVEHKTDSGYRPDLPMNVLMDRRQGGFEWLIQESPKGSCFLLFSGLNVAFLVPCVGKVHFEFPPFIQGEVRTLVTTGENSWNVSPVLIFPEKGKVLKWSSNP